ncbi:LarC family nickel insertion protein [Propioniciclava soli]|uniref:LarC family nickel insertion protein n=1 Tax=Propioniciclava soli TaxID=2775081 RepID=UPI001E43D45C|nr:LarC family nickel insertion protein [Propioniciclava soli]
MVHAWFDVTAGVAGDMVLGSLLDAGADVAAVQQALDAVAPGSVRLETEVVDRAGQRGTKARVRVLTDDPPHRTWRSIRARLAEADLDPTTRDRALAVFGRLADAEGATHGIAPDDVHFHEVGALDSIADVVGSCEALRLLGVTSVSASPVALGSGRVRAAHGDIPVPVPAVARLVVGWRTLASAGTPRAHAPGHAHPHAHPYPHGHQDDPATGAHDTPAEVLPPGEPGELATPTGVALIRALADVCEALPPLLVTGLGVGAGGRDTPGRPNVVRVMLGESVADHPATDLAELRANVDDLDPRLWPGVLDACLAAGAADAWLVPIQMKKGRPAFTVHALADAASRPRIIDVLLSHTTTLGVRESPVTRTVLDRSWTDVDVLGQSVRVKVGARGGRVLHAAAEFASVVDAARALGVPEAEVAQRAAAAIVAAGLMPGVRHPQ